MISIILFLIITICTALLFYKRHSCYINEIDNIDQRIFPLKKLLPVGLAIIDLIKYSFKSRYDERQRYKLSRLYGENKVNLYLRVHMANNICLVILITVIILFLGSLLWIQASLNKGMYLSSLKDNTLQRPDFGEGDKMAELNARLSKGNAEALYDYRITLKELPPQNDEQAVRRAWELLNEDMIRGRNYELGNVTQSLNLKRTYEVFKGWGVDIAWSSSVSELKSDGSIAAPMRGQAPIPAVLTADITKNKAKAKKEFNILIKPQLQSEEEKQLESARAQIDIIIKNASASNDNKILTLPNELEGYAGMNINWEDKLEESKTTEQSSILGYLVLILFAGAMGIFLQEREINTRIAVRHRQIQLEFPIFLTKLLLLINAGMTINSAWERITDEGSKHTPLYKELNAVVTEIKSGTPEHQAYESFAQRCRTAEISKFVSIIIQNLRKGNSELVQLLKLQARECWESRKNAAKRLGEEASTKLLLPMVLMLLGILIIVSTPALLAINSF